MFGYIEIDTDESATTGTAPLSNGYGASALGGIDYIISLIGSTTSTVRVVGPGGTATVAPVTYTGNTLVIRLPMQALGNDDGRFSLVGVIGTIDRPTDVFPNAGAFIVHPGRSVASRGLPLSISPTATRAGRLTAAADWGDARR